MLNFSSLVPSDDDFVHKFSVHRVEMSAIL